jgi:hypothetical protein
MRALVIAMFVLLSSVSAARAEVHVGINIGINMPVYPHLTVVPRYPVYYDPDADGNYFFYDGQYWVYDDDNWYASSWYNGPWVLVEPFYVPVYVLRVPVRYYRRPPVYFSAWRRDAPPRWGEHWGRDWEQRRNGWDPWDRRSVPHAAPLPTYQRQYSGERYPHDVTQQRSLGAQNYRYQPRDPVAQHVQQRINSARPDVQSHEQPRDQSHNQMRNDAPPQRSSRQQPTSQQREIEQQHRQQNPPRQRDYEPERRQQPMPERAQPSPSQRPQSESHDRGDRGDRGREDPSATRGMGRERGNKDHGDRGDDRH